MTLSDETAYLLASDPVLWEFWKSTGDPTNVK